MRTKNSNCSSEIKQTRITQLGGVKQATCFFASLLQTRTNLIKILNLRILIKNSLVFAHVIRIYITRNDITLKLLYEHWELGSGIDFPGVQTQLEMLVSGFLIIFKMPIKKSSPILSYFLFLTVSLKVVLTTPS